MKCYYVEAIVKGWNIGWDFKIPYLILLKNLLFLQIISKKKPNENNAIIDTNKTKKDPKLIIVNMNNNNLNENNKYDDKNITIEDYKDAASQIANHLLIESLMSLENEDDI